MSKIPTIKVRWPAAYPNETFVNINEHDFDPAVHERYEEGTESEAAPENPTPDASGSPEGAQSQTEDADDSILSQMTKAQLVEYGKATFGLDLNASQTKDKLIAAIQAAQK